VPVSNEGKEIKITDKRMFTPDGELREEYRFLEEKSTTEPPAGVDAPVPAAPAPPGPAPPPDRAAGARSGQTVVARPGDGAYAEPGHGGDVAGWVADGGEPGAAGEMEDGGARLELPTSAPGPGPSFYDLAAMLAEPVAIYLGDVELPDGQSAENLEMARLYIDLLDVLRQKTVGNLTAQESGFLEDLLYRMRVRYVQKRG